MKKILTLVLITVFLSSCVDWVGGPTYEKSIENISKFDLTETLKVPTKSGYVTVIQTKSGDTLAVTNQPTQIVVPLIEEVIITYLSELDYNPTRSGKNYVRKFTLAFEDIGGDLDYNDLVLKVEERVHFDAGAGTSHKITFNVYPVARGAKEPAKLGYILYTNNIRIQEGYVSTDVKNELFPGRGDFVNVYKHLPQDLTVPPYQKTITFPFYESSILSLRIVYFLEFGGGRNYIAVNYRTVNQAIPFNYQISVLGYPYGILIPYWGFRYPEESSRIQNSYLDFEKWKNGEINNPFLSNIDYTRLY